MPQSDQNIHHFTISSTEQVGIRIDKFILAQLKELNVQISRSRIQKLIENNSLVDSKGKSITNNSSLTKLNDELIIDLSENINQDEQTLIAKDIDFEIVFEDQYLAVINKPAGLTTHPGIGNYDNTLVNGLLFRFKDSLSDHNGNHRPGIVHRLDKDTSGLMVVAKDNQSHALLSQAIQDKEITRKYLTYIYGVMNPSSGKIEKEISRNKFNRLKMTTTRSGTKYRSATTIYNTIKVFNDGFVSLIECQLLTGRTHQIRVHLEATNHSVVGDQVYNSCKKQPPKHMFESKRLEFINNFPRQALHSHYIDFIHPITKEHLKFQQDPPKDMQDLNENLK